MTTDKLPVEILHSAKEFAQYSDADKGKIEAAWLAGYAVKHDELQAQAQRMADALEIIANSPVPANEREMVSWILTARALAVEQLQQFKDGKGKEKAEPTISKCGICHKEGVNQYLGSQFYLCDECFENYEQSRDQP